MICYERVYCFGQADTSAKKRIVVPISCVTGNTSRLMPCLVGHLPFAKGM